MKKVIFWQNQEQITVETPSGTTILEAARTGGLEISAPCAGGGTCGKCQVERSNGSGRRETLLACQTMVDRDMEIYLTEEREDKANMQILAKGRRGAISLNTVHKVYIPLTDRTQIWADGTMRGSEPGDTRASLLGAAVDIGTTTMVVALIDLITGKELAVSSALNPQAAYAQDVLSRIRLGRTEEGLAQLHDDVTDELAWLLAEAARQCGRRTEEIYEVVVCGNTCMLHLFEKENPAALGKYPYVSRIAGGEEKEGDLYRLGISPIAKVYLPPVISGYVGADIVAGMLAVEMDQQEESVLFVDVGTNGELVLAHQGRMWATSTAAGPAFEGMNISCGMRAVPGAVERVAINESGRVEYSTIGNGSPAGLCGSGLIDAVGELVAKGWIDSRGRFQQPDHSQEESLLALRDGKKVCCLASEVWLSQNDVRQVQLAKGAVRSGIDALLDQAEVVPEKLSRVLIAGSFGSHLAPEHLIHIGMLPSETADKIEFVGNTAKSGSEMLLLNHELRQRVYRMSQQVEVIELANLAGFENRFVASLAFDRAVGNQ